MAGKPGCGPNQPQTLTGIETLKTINGIPDRQGGPINLKPLQGLKQSTGAGGRGWPTAGPINLKPLQGLKRHCCRWHLRPIGAQSTSNPYRD